MKTEIRLWEKMFRVEILFHSASTPKVIENALSVYTKGDLLCVQLTDDLIVKYPLLNVFSVSHKHGDHWGANAHIKPPEED